MNVGKFLTGWFMITLILVLISAGAFIHRDKILALASTIQARFTQPSLEAGLIGYWSFNGADVTDKVYDRSGQGKHGFFVGGATSTAETIGLIGQALNFDGVNDYVYLGDGVGESASAMTVAAWVNLASSVGGRILSKWGNYTPSTDGYLFSLGDAGSNRVRFAVRLTSGAVEYCDTTTGAATSTWIFFVGSYDGSNCHTYVNGVEESTKTEGGTGTMTTGTTPLRIGVEGSDGTSSPFPGKLDELRIYNRALSLGEIKQLYNLGVGSKVNTSQNDQMTNGLVGLWSFDGTDLTDKVYDRSGNGNNGFLVGVATATAEVPGKIGQALSFDGTDDYVRTASFALNTTGVRTFSAWIKPRSITNAYILEQNDTLLELRATGVIRLYWSGGLAHSTTDINITADTWYHIVAMETGGLNYQIYVNGIKYADEDDGFATHTGTGSDALDIGRWSSGGAQFPGVIDDVRVYNRALSVDEIKHLYNKGLASVANASQNDQMTNGLIGLWSFDGADVTDKVYDRSGQGNNGFFSGGATSSAEVIGKVGQALNFDGVNDRVTMGDPAVLDIAGARTISAWIYPKSSGGNSLGRIVDKNSGATNGYIFYFQGVSVTNGLTYAVGSGAAGAAVTTLSNVLTLNQWQHVVFTCDASFNAAIYINGSSTPITGSLSSCGSAVSDNFNIGGRTTDNARNFDGKIDEVRVYNRALSADEVRHLYNKGR